MIIPQEYLSKDAIDNLIQEYCLRDWGLNESEAPLREREEAVRRALERGELVILYSELHETAQLIDRRDITTSEEC
ncbi:MAG: YheU family protein [Oleiphilaceae bacterium]|nr:YheU family protein [Oleiphilaceae bacterium]